MYSAWKSLINSLNQEVTSYYWNAIRILRNIRRNFKTWSYIYHKLEITIGFFLHIIARLCPGHACYHFDPIELNSRELIRISTWKQMKKFAFLECTFLIYFVKLSTQGRTSWCLKSFVVRRRYEDSMQIIDRLLTQMSNHIFEIR